MRCSSSQFLHHRHCVLCFYSCFSSSFFFLLLLLAQSVLGFIFSLLLRKKKKEHTKHDNQNPKEKGNKKG